MNNQQVGWSVESKLLQLIAKELEKLAGALSKLRAASSTPSQITITTSTSITAATLDANGVSQNGKNVILNNGATPINFTINAPLTTSFMKGGTGAITFLAGAGRTLVAVDVTTPAATLNGIVGSTATITSVGTTDYLRISNA